MAIGALFEAPGFTSDTDDSVLASRRRGAAAGLPLYHVARPVEGGSGASSMMAGGGQAGG